MQGFLLQRLSSRRLLALLVVCGVLIIIFFIVGEAVYPNYDRTQSDEGVLNICDGRNDLRAYDVKSCHRFPNRTVNSSLWQGAVHMLKLPIGAGSYTPWNQYIIMSLQMDLEVNDNSVLNPTDKTALQFEVTLESTFFRKNLPSVEWDLFSGITQTRTSFSCHMLQDKKTLRCDPTAYFELNSVNYDVYLLNIRASVRSTNNADAKIYVKRLKAKVTSLREKFTKSFLAVKLLFFPLSLIAMLWHINKAKRFDEDETIFHGKQLIAAGIAICFLNLPIEWLTLWVSLPPIQLLYDIRLVIFYAALFYFAAGFLRYFVEERPRRFRIKCFCILKKFYTVDVAVPIICFSLVVFYTCYSFFADIYRQHLLPSSVFFKISWIMETWQFVPLRWCGCSKNSFSHCFPHTDIAGHFKGLFIRVSILGNFFYSYEVSQSIQEAILAYIATVGVLAFLFSLYQILPVVWSMPALRRERQYTTRVTFFVAMVSTVAVLVLTTIYFLIADLHGLLLVYGRVFKISGALYTGIYGIWNIYLLSFLYLFAPEKIPETPIDIMQDVDIIDAGIKVSTEEVEEK